ncbi:MAG: hypothetical protein LBQ09_02160 [Acidobacteriaceae bacterium]|jgi:hypothetical protein|nr:hypothetical protein [Acidobacteriaceae bacterium]
MLAALFVMFVTTLCIPHRANAQTPAADKPTWFVQGGISASNEEVSKPEWRPGLSLAGGVFLSPRRSLRWQAQVPQWRYRVTEIQDPNYPQISTVGKRLSTFGMLLAFQHRNTGKLRVASMVGLGEVVESTYGQSVFLKPEQEHLGGSDRSSLTALAALVGLEGEYLLSPRLSVVVDTTLSIHLGSLLIQPLRLVMMHPVIPVPLTLQPSVTARWRF